MDSSIYNAVTKDADHLMYIASAGARVDCNAAWAMQTGAIRNIADNAFLPDQAGIIEFDNDVCLDDYYRVPAPPPSPQEPSMLEAVFAERLNGSLEAVRRNESPEVLDNDNLSGRRYPSRLVYEHAKALDRLLCKTQQERKHIQKSQRASRLKTKSLYRRKASELAEAIALIQLSNEHPPMPSTSSL